jgi:hypothetical protein
MKSKARSEPLLIGCQHSTGRRAGAGPSVMRHEEHQPGNATASALT